MQTEVETAALVPIQRVAEAPQILSDQLVNPLAEFVATFMPHVSGVVRASMRADDPSSPAVLSLFDGEPAEGKLIEELQVMGFRMETRELYLMHEGQLITAKDYLQQKINHHA